MPLLVAQDDTPLQCLVEDHGQAAYVLDAKIPCTLRKVRANPTSSLAFINAMPAMPNSKKHLHLTHRDHRTIRVDVTTSFEEIFARFDGIQYHNCLAEDAKTQDIAWHSLDQE